MIAGSSKLWILGMVLAAVMFFIGILSMSSTLSAGIEVKGNIVVFPDMDLSKGKQPQFELSNLADIILRNGDGKELDPEKDSLYGARFVFLLKDGGERIYYPVALTAKQYETVKNGILLLAGK